MTDTAPRTDLDLVRKHLEAAEQMVFDLCRGRQRWTMRVPVEEDRDSDTVIMAALNDLRRLIDEAEPVVPGLTARLEAAEKVCLMFGWMAADRSQRGKAAHELWSEWVALYRAAGGTLDKRQHPELSEEVERQLADRRDATEHRVVAAALRGGPDDPD